MHTKIFVSLLFAALISGCGFHLRGIAPLPEGVNAVHVRAPSTVLADEVSIFLEAGGARATESSEEADAVLNVSSEQFARRVLSVDPQTGKEREFELAYTVSFDLVGSDGKALLAGESLRLLRDFVFDADAVLGKSREEGVLRDEMRRDAAQQIVRRIASISK